MTKTSELATILLGAASLDIYKENGRILPGGGCLNMAYHWRQLGFPHLFLTRIGTDGAQVFRDFFQRHQIAYLPESLVGNGRTPAIDIAFLPDRQIYMDNFVEGVLADFQLTPAEEGVVAQAERVHTVLVDSLMREVHRLAERGVWERPFLSADFLDFRHFTLERFAKMMPLVDLGFIGWPKESDDPLLPQLRQIVFDLGKLLVVTLGSRGVLVWDGRIQPQELFFNVEAIPVQGSTVGCGDAFIAYFLAEFWRSGDLNAAVAQGKLGGARATEWKRPLPEKAY
ncbi:PfkB family carbohydrate kinase [Candidatus Leptofilum sp.]|uniref:PfkB family carbohydrate kinase n=1 Tax=Candidatus Leptofilum sp. TaxID=3241576 RepID=UPI003B5C8658